MCKRVQIRSFRHAQTSSVSLRHCRLYRRRSYSSTSCKSSEMEEKPVINPVGIQYLSRDLHKQLFTGKIAERDKYPIPAEEKVGLVELSKHFLKNYHLLGKKTSVSEPISFELPKLQGESLDEHFQRLGHFASEPYRSMCQEKFVEIVQRPKKWIRKEGWMRYEPGKDPEPVPWPLEDVFVFDVETLYKISPYPTLAVALSDKAWYLWCSPFICGSDSFEHLIPLNTQERKGLAIGHNVAYDRSRVLEEYNLKPSKTFFMDTQSLHVASSGLSSRQRPKFLKVRNSNGKVQPSPKEYGDVMVDDQMYPGLMNTEMGSDRELQEDPWLKVSAMNSLEDVALLHCGIHMNKESRDRFATTDKNEIIRDFQELVEYCATDVDTTSRVFDKVWPLFLEKCPHPVSFGALRTLSSCILPTHYGEWVDYLNRSEGIYRESKQNIENKIIEIVEDIVKLKDRMDEVYKDPWLRQLDWTTRPVKLTKKGLPVKNQKLPGYPEWYRALFRSKNETRPQITIKSRNIPIFFKLSWEGYPTIWTENGWCFITPVDLIEKFKSKNYKMADEDVIENYRSEINDLFPGGDENRVLFKIPHPNGPQYNCTTLLSKPYIHYFEKGILTSGSDFAREALNMNSSGSYWMAARERIMNQFNVPGSKFPTQFNSLDGSQTQSSYNKNDMGIIVPDLVPMGTVTRRAVENTWLTASNAKENRIGSELKTQIRAPEGYSFVGADVDSEELWIASLVSDSVFRIHGGTAIGWMCLEGTKSEGTDLHTKTAQILGCNRNEAKIFNYGRIYGAGVKFASQLLKKFNPSLPNEEAQRIANQLYEGTKGKIQRSKIFRKFWYGGSESILFNKLESIAEQDEPRTPVLGCGITFSLMKKNLGANTFLPSRINWTIQSSGVDYLHLLCCSMNYLLTIYHIKARLCISIHDEIRFLVANEDKYRAAMALQISNLWTRAIFCEQMGIQDLPQNCAFFSAVDIDKLLRKEVNMDCITPSNLKPIPHGESIDIGALLERPDAILTNPDPTIDVSHFPATYREPVLSKYNEAHNKQYRNYLLRMQLQNTKWKVDDLEKAYVQETEELAFKGKHSTTYGLLDYLKDVRKDRKKKKSIMDTTVSGQDDILSSEQPVVSGIKKAQKVMQHQRRTHKKPNKRKALYRGNKAFEAFYNNVDKNVKDVPEVPVKDVVHDLMTKTPQTSDRAKKPINRIIYAKRTSTKNGDDGNARSTVSMVDRHEKYAKEKSH